MTHEEFLAAFHNQLTELLKIGAELKVTRDSQGLPSDALSYAEMLSLCPDHQAAVSQMKKDPASARSFLDIAAFQEKHLTDIPTSSAVTHLQGTTPYFVLASAMQEYLLYVKKVAPEKWK